MSRDRHRQVEEIFQDLLDLPAEKRKAVLADRCGDDDALRQEVTTLLEHYEAANPDFLEEPVFARGADDDELPESVGPYTVVGRLGEGGMGVIYEAEQEHPKRRIAVKVLRAGLYSKSQLSRFRNEWDALGRLGHPGIANVYGAGMGEVVFAGRFALELPYLAMELVRGRNLVEHVEDAQLDRSSRLKLFAEICDAVEYAHEQSVIHRDLKPRNIVVDASGRPKILDFGVARITDEERTQNTRTGDVIGTVRYMSPEQLFGNRDVDARSDVYSLGVILYELLTGESPYGDTTTSITDRILWHERGSVPRIGEHDPTLKGDIDAIVRMAMATDVADRYQSVAGLRDDIRRHMRKEPVIAPVERRRDSWRRLVHRRRVALFGTAASIVVAAAVAMQFVDPFGGESSLGKRIAAGDRLAVMYFDDVSGREDPARHGEVVTELLISGLSQSERLNIVSSQRLYDVLKLLGKEGEKKIDRTTATEVATRASARWMMLGRILQSEPNFVVTSQIVDVETGDVAASQLTEGTTGESIFSLVDRITASTLDVLDVREAGAGPRPVADMSSSSEDAYRYYLEGIGNARTGSLQEARESFTKALEIDSTFAMAAFRLGFLTTGATSTYSPERRRLFRQALRHADRASPREQLYLKSAPAVAEHQWIDAIPAFEAVLEKYPDDKFALEMLAIVARNYPEQQIAYARRLLELDPTNPEALYNLAFAYGAARNLEGALNTIDRLVELYPGDPGPYAARGDVYTRFGRLDEAVASYQKVIEIKPDVDDYYYAAGQLGNAYLFKGEYEQAEAQYRRLFESPRADVRRRGRWLFISILTYRGRFAKASTESEASLAVDRMEGEALPTDPVGEAETLVELGETARAFEAIEQKCAEGFDDVLSCVEASRVLARMGRGDEADRCLAPLRARVDSLWTFDRWLFDMTRARVTAARGDYDDAIARYNAMWDDVKRQRRPYWFYRFCYDFAEVCFEAERWTDVIRIVEEALTGYSIHAFPGIRDARFHYFLGVAYQEVGRNEEAMERLEKLLTIWDGADPGLVGLDDARTRLAALRAGD